MLRHLDDGINTFGPTREAIERYMDILGDLYIGKESSSSFLSLRALYQRIKDTSSWHFADMEALFQKCHSVFQSISRENPDISINRS